MQMRQLVVVQVESVEDLPARLRPYGPCFGLLLISSAWHVDEAVMGRVASSLKQQGVAYVSVWGEDSERIHDLVDTCFASTVGVERSDTPVIMTTWHVDGIDEALDFFTYAALPDEEWISTCHAWIVCVVGSPELVPIVRQLVSAKE